MTEEQVIQLSIWHEEDHMVVLHNAIEDLEPHDEARRKELEAEMDKTQEEINRLQEKLNAT